MKSGSVNKYHRRVRFLSISFLWLSAVYVVQAVSTFIDCDRWHGPCEESFCEMRCERNGLYILPRINYVYASPSPRSLGLT